ncbi:MAG TPA: CHRD domain-containing protein [Burkholderiales bacterium]|nr:CHRD domain-containing protein [Burkholderiales bacterium]
MKLAFRKLTIVLLTAALALLLGTAGAAGGQQEIKMTLNGKQEVPPVETSASGSGTITISSDGSVSGSITTSGVTSFAAHIHQGATGTNGPVIIPLVKTSDNVWTVPAGAKLTDAQYKSFLAGELYINVHSAAHKGGEIRGQINPK